VTAALTAAEFEAATGTLAAGPARIAAALPLIDAA
jgi:hypothetical protein